MNLFAELQRRNVIRVAVFYGVTGWVLLEVAELLFEILLVPDWGIRFLFGLLALAFPVVLFLAWAYELTPDGIRREADLEPDRPQNSATARKLDIAVIVVIVLGVIVVWAARRPMPRDDSALPERPGADAQSRDAGTAGAKRVEDGLPGRSIAVLPFVNLSDDPENEYFADGLSEELLNVLAQVPDLLVAGRTSSFAFKDHNENLTTIGSTLGVANLLEGSVRRQHDQVRVTAQLIRAADGFHLWSQSYDRTLDDVFAIQDDIARNVANALAIVLDEDARARMERTGIRNVEAFIAYQKAYELFDAAHGDRPLLPTLAEANRYFDQAIALAPEFAAAWTYWGDYYAHLLMTPGIPQAQRERALEQQRLAFDRAYEHAREPARKAFIDFARVLFSDDWGTLTDRLDRALAFGGCPQTAWTNLLAPMGHNPALQGLWRRRVACDPLVASNRINLIGSLLLDGRTEQAQAEIDTVRKTIGNSVSLDGFEMMLLIKLGRFEDAEMLGMTIPVETEFWGFQSRVWPLAAQNRIEEGFSMLETVRKTRGPGFLLGLSVLGPLGDRDAANASAAQLDAVPGGPLILLNAVSACACGAPFDLEATPRFAARLEESGLPWPPQSVIDFPAKDW